MLTKAETIAEIKKDPHPYMALLFMFSFFGLKADKIRGKVTEFVIDKVWRVKINGNKEKVDGIPAYCFYLYYKDIPAGIFAPNGAGEMVESQGANEGTLIEAIILRLEAESDASPDSTSEGHSPG